MAASQQPAWKVGPFENPFKQDQQQKQQEQQPGWKVGPFENPFKQDQQQQQLQKSDDHEGHVQENRHNDHHNNNNHNAHLTPYQQFVTQRNDELEQQEGRRLGIAMPSRRLGRTARAEKSKEEVLKIGEEFGLPTEILPHLYLGSGQNAVDQALLKELGITAVLNVADEVTLLPGVDGRKLGIDDVHTDYNIWFACFTYIESVLRDGGKILVHCVRGRSRSAALVIAYVMLHSRMSLKDAYLFVKLKRRVIGPHRSLKIQLLQFEKYCFRYSNDEAQLRKEPAEKDRYKPEEPKEKKPSKKQQKEAQPSKRSGKKRGPEKKIEKRLKANTATLKQLTENLAVMESNGALPDKINQLKKRIAKMQKAIDNNLASLQRLSQEGAEESQKIDAEEQKEEEEETKGGAKDVTEEPTMAEKIASQGPPQVSFNSLADWEHCEESVMTPEEIEAERARARQKAHRRKLINRYSRPHPNRWGDNAGVGEETAGQQKDKGKRTGKGIKRKRGSEMTRQANAAQKEEHEGKPKKKKKKQRTKHTTRDDPAATQQQDGKSKEESRDQKEANKGEKTNKTQVDKKENEANSEDRGTGKGIKRKRGPEEKIRQKEDTAPKEEHEGHPKSNKRKQRVKTKQTKEVTPEDIKKNKKKQKKQRSKLNKKRKEEGANK